MAIIMTNQQWDGFVLCACFGILIVNEVMRERQSEAASQRPLYAGALCLGVLLFVPQFAGDLFGLGYGLWSKEAARSDVDAGEAVAAEQLVGLARAGPRGPPSWSSRTIRRAGCASSSSGTTVVTNAPVRPSGAPLLRGRNDLRAPVADERRR